MRCIPGLAVVDGLCLRAGPVRGKSGRSNVEARCVWITLGVYLVGSGLTALTLGNSVGWIVFLYVTRFIAGMGIGGEYAAINSAIDELIPARFRGRVDIAVNGTYWGGAILGTLGTFIFLKTVDLSLGWRLAFLLGPVLGLVILFVRRHLPESPRWQVMNGRVDAAEKSISYIEREVEATGVTLPAVDESKAIELQPTEKIGYLALTRVLFREYPSRSILGASLMISQSFLYNAIFFTYTLVLGKFYGVPSGSTPLYSHRVRRRKPHRPSGHRALLRHHRPQEDDRRHVPTVRCSARRQRSPVQRRESSTRSLRRSRGASSSSSPRPEPAPPISPSARSSRSRFGRRPLRCSSPSPSASAPSVRLSTALSSATAPTR